MVAKVAIVILVVAAIGALGFSAMVIGAGHMADGQRSMMDPKGYGMMGGSSRPMNGNASDGRNCSMDPQDCPRNGDGAMQNCPNHRT